MNESDAAAVSGDLTMQPIPESAVPRLVARPLSARAPDHHRRPVAGEVHVWRFQSHWVPVQSAISHAWLSPEEWEMARRHGTPIARRRFLTTRVVLRWLLGGVMGLPSDHACLADIQAGKIILAPALTTASSSAPALADTPPLFVDVTQVGAWTLIGMAAEPIALGVVTSAPHRTRFGRPPAGERLGNALGDVMSSRDAGRARAALLPGMDAVSTDRWTTVDLPMPMPVAVSIACACPPDTIRGFGWRAGESLGPW